MRQRSRCAGIAIAADAASRTAHPRAHHRGEPCVRAAGDERRNGSDGERDQILYARCVEPLARRDQRDAGRDGPPRPSSRPRQRLARALNRLLSRNESASRRHAETALPERNAAPRRGGAHRARPATDRSGGNVRAARPAPAHGRRHDHRRAPVARPVGGIWRAARPYGRVRRERRDGASLRRQRVAAKEDAAPDAQRSAEHLGSCPGCASSSCSPPTSTTLIWKRCRRSSRTAPGFGSWTFSD